MKDLFGEEIVNDRDRKLPAKRGGFLIAYIMIKFHRVAREHGISPLIMSFLFFASSINGEKVSKTSLARMFGCSRSGVYQMIGKVADLVTVELTRSGLYRLTVTKDGQDLLNRIMTSL